MKFKQGDKAVVTGPLLISGQTVEDSFVGLTPGSVVVVEEADDDDALVLDGSDDLGFWIAVSSLTPHDEFLEAPDFDWSTIHDYVHEGDDA